MDQYQHAVLRYDNLLLFGGVRRVLDGNAVPHAYSDMFSEIADSHHAEVNENHKTGGRRKAPGFMRKQQRFSLHCLPGCGTIAVLRQGSTTMKTTAMTAEEHVRYMTQAPVRRLILEMSAPTVILCTMLLQTIGMAWQASVVAAARQGLFLIPVVFILPNLLGLAGVEYAQPAADLLAFALALPMGLSVLKTFRSDAPTPAHTLREE